MLSKAFHPCPEFKLDPRNRYKIFHVTTLLFVPLVIILSSYSYIFIVSYNHRKQIREQSHNREEANQETSNMKQQLRASLTLGIIVALCFGSIIPLAVVTSLLLTGTRCLVIAQGVSFDVAFGLNAICNPIIYGWRNKTFRSSLRKLLKCV